jgi:hypothetical protein
MNIRAMKTILILLIALVSVSCAKIGIEPPDGYYVSGPQEIALNGSNFTGHSEKYAVMYPYIDSSGNQAVNLVFSFQNNIAIFLYQELNQISCHL